MSDDEANRRRGTGRRANVDGASRDAGWRPTRRGVLRGTAAATAAAGLGGVALGQDDGEALDPSETIVLGGLTEGWVGEQPEAIADETNPTLNLQAGESYEVEWTNEDGLPHNFVVLDAEESVIERTEIISEQGASQTLSFTASEEMATYLCEVHPTSMRGAIQFGETDGAAQEGPQLAAVPEGPEIGLQTVAGGDPINQPVDFRTVTVDGTERQFIVDQTGEIYLVTEDGVESFLDITELLLIRNEGFDERGLLGLAFHPDFQNNRRFYVRYSSYPRERELPDEYDHMFLLSEFQANEAATSADPDSERVLLEIPEPQFNHNAGDLAFGPDGMLYVPTGDGGGANDVGIGHVNDWYETNRGGNGQDVTENLLGSILRIDVDARDGDQPYGIPDDNPLVDTDGLDEQWAWGFRNPWRISWNDGTLIVADVGQNLYEEIDVVEAGGNYGWNVREGSHCFSAENPAQPEAITECPTNAPDEAPYDGQPLASPALEYPHTVDGAAVGVSITGGYVYQGETVPGISGSYVFGDYSATGAQPTGRLWIADVTGETDGPADGTDDESETSADNETAMANETTDEAEVENVTVGNETDGVEGNVTADNGTVGNETEMFNETGDGNAAGNGVDDGNVTTDNGVGDGNETANGNATADGNATAGDGADGPGAAADLPMREITVANAPDNRINRTVLGFGRDGDGELYVCTSTTTGIAGTGDVYRVVPPEEGEQIEAPASDGGGN